MSKQKQQGASIILTIIILGLLAILVVAGIKMVPVYLQYYSMVKILEKMQDDPKLKNAQKQDIITTFEKYLDIGSIYNVTRDHYTVTKVKGKPYFKFELDYAAKRELVGNISLVADFYYTTELGK